MSTVQLRPYQQDGIERLRDGIRAKRFKQVLVSPTGSGKTEMAAHLLQEARAKGTRVLFIVDRIVLVDQTSQRLDDYGIPHGIIQSGHWRIQPYEQVQVASAQTLEKRDASALDEFGLIIVDECHCLREGITAMLAESKAIIVGLTATPFARGMAKIYAKQAVNVTTMNKLVADGFLVPLKTYIATPIDMVGAKMVAGEWSQREVQERGTKIVGDIVTEWVDKTNLLFNGPVKTLVFAGNVAHGEAIVREFQEAGHNFLQISYKDTSEDERKALIAEFKKPDSTIMGLVSCEILTKGFDVPDVLCGISARPYKKSLSSHLQQMGRIMRRAEGKTFGLWLDHTGNVQRFLRDVIDVFEHGVSQLDDGVRDSTPRKEPTEKERKDIRCLCGFQLMPWDKVCGGCGKARAPRSTAIENVPGRMQELSNIAPLLPGASKASIRPEFADKLNTFLQIHSYALQKHGNPENAKSFTLANYKTLYGEWPRFEFGRHTVKVEMHVQSWLENQARRYHIARNKMRMKGELRA